jgi:hypothetical protein
MRCSSGIGVGDGGNQMCKVATPLTDSGNGTEHTTRQIVRLLSLGYKHPQTLLQLLQKH